MDNEPTQSILYVSIHVPNNNGSGSEKRAWAQLQSLKRMGDVTLVIIDFGQQPNLQYLKDLEPALSQIETISCVKRQTGRARLVGLTFLKELVLGRANPIEVSTGGEHLFDKLFKKNQFSFVFCFKWISAIVFLEQSQKAATVKIPFYVDFDDIESIAIRRQLEFHKKMLGLELYWVERIQILRQKYREKYLSRKAKQVFICSEGDQLKLSSITNTNNVSVLPNIVSDIQARRPVNDISTVTLLFVGAMFYRPNEDAMLFFVNEILPLLSDISEQKITLYIVGFKPPNSILALHNGTTVIVTGGVESLEPYYERADVAICPIRHGGGTRIKIIEAMTKGVPVVSTNIGAEGLNATDGKNILLADSPKQFAEKIHNLISDKKSRETISINAYNFALQHYSQVTVDRVIDACIID